MALQLLKRRAAKDESLRHVGSFDRQTLISQSGKLTSASNLLHGLEMQPSGIGLWDCPKCKYTNIDSEHCRVCLSCKPAVVETVEKPPKGTVKVSKQARKRDKSIRNSRNKRAKKAEYKPVVCEELVENEAVVLDPTKLANTFLLVEQHEAEFKQEVGNETNTVVGTDRFPLLLQNARIEEKHVQLAHNALYAYDPTNPYSHAGGVYNQFKGNLSDQQLRFYLGCINRRFLEAMSDMDVDVLRRDPDDWMYLTEEIPAGSTAFVYLKVVRAKVSFHREVCRNVMANSDGLYSVFTVRRAKQMLKDLEGFNPDDVINVTYVGETLDFILRMLQKYPLVMEQSGITHYGVVAAIPNGTKRDCLALESLILALFQLRLGTNNLHKGMFSWNLVHGGLRPFSGKTMNGHQINSFLAQNHCDYKDTQLRMIPGVHTSILSMVELYSEEIDVFLGKTTDDILSNLTLGEFNRFWGHIIGTRNFQAERGEGRGLWGDYLEKNIELHGGEMAEYFGIQPDQLQNITHRDFSRWHGHKFGFGSVYSRACWDLFRNGTKPTKKQLSDPKFDAAWQNVNNSIASAHMGVRRLIEENNKPSQELLDANPTLAFAWTQDQVWDLIRVNQEPTKEQRSDPNFMAAWDIVNKTAAAANARVRHLVKEGVVPSQERLDAEPALANAWKRHQKNQQRWEEIYVLLRRYIVQCNGNWNGTVPSHYKTKCGEDLGNWIGQQRRQKRDGLLLPSREAELRGVGLKW